MSRLRLSALAALLVLLLAAPLAAAQPEGEGAVVSPPKSAASPEAEAPARPRIALMPIELPRTMGPAVVHCPICGVGLAVGEIAPGASERLTELLYGWLPAHRCFAVLDPGMAEGAYARLLRETMTGTTVSYMQGVGKALGAEAVLGGIVYRWRERVGTAYSISRAASIGFDLHLVRTSDGAVIWSGHFDETQKDLSENIFNIFRFFKRGARWLTVDEFAAQAVSETLKGFPHQLPPGKEVTK